VAVEKIDNIDVKLFLKEVSTILVERSSQRVKLYDLFEMYAARKVYEAASTVPNDLEKNRVEEVIRAKIAELSLLVNPFEAGQRERGFVYESAKARWERYRKVEREGVKAVATPFGIEELDKYTNGGIRDSNIVLFFASSGGFKTKLKANLAYNFSFLANKDVMVITLEVPKEDYETIIDSRHSLLNFNSVTAGRLIGEDREKHRKALKQLTETRPPLYIVDIPDKATTADVIVENELYYTKFGFYPKIEILDYINEIEPVQPWGNTGEKFKNVGVELRRAARVYKYGMVTSAQETRGGKDLKDKANIDTQHIGESHSLQNVCHVIAYLYQDDEGIDESTNILNIAIKKNRYGPKHVTFPVFANPAINYIGDRRVTLITPQRAPVSALLGEKKSDVQSN